METIFVNPILHILEDFSETSFNPLLDCIMESMSVRPESIEIFKRQQNMKLIVPVAKIVYAEADSHMVNIYLTSGERIETYGPIKELSEKLKKYAMFIFPHRSFIVNAFYISCITPDMIFMRSVKASVPIARGKIEHVKEAYNRYYEGYGRNVNTTISHQYI